MITAKTNQQLKKVRKLLSSAKERRESGLFVIEGFRLFSEAPAELLETVFVSEEREGDFLREMKKPPQYEVVESGLFRGLSDTVNPQGVLAVLRQPSHGRPDFTGRSLLLDGIRDPGNMGTIIRTAEAAGMAAVFLSPDCVDLYNPKVIRSTMGSIFRVPVYTMPLLPVIGELKKKETRVYATSLKAVRSYKEADLSRAAVVIGSEASGVSAEVMDACTDMIKIPMAGQVESLNAAVSAAILMFC